MLADINRQVVMKVMHVNECNEWKHKFRLILRYYLRGIDKKAFRCCGKAYSYNLATPEPLAYWKNSNSLVHFRSYFLYQYIDVSFLWQKTYKELRKAGDVDSNQKSDLIIQKNINALKSLHRQGIRHGDLASRNILMSIQGTDKLSNAKVYFVDYDDASLTKIKYPTFIRRFFDIKDLQSMRTFDTSPYEILKIYLGDSYHPWWNIVLAFWQQRKLKKISPSELKRLKRGCVNSKLTYRIIDKVLHRIVRAK